MHTKKINIYCLLKYSLLNKTYLYSFLSLGDLSGTTSKYFKEALSILLILKLSTCLFFIENLAYLMKFCFSIDVAFYTVSSSLYVDLLLLLLISYMTVTNYFRLNVLKCQFDYKQNKNKFQM